MSFYWFNARGISEWESRPNVNMKKDSCIAINSLNALWFMTKITFHLAILLRYRFSEVVNFQFPARYLQCDHNRVAIMIRESSQVVGKIYDSIMQWICMIRIELQNSFISHVSTCLHDDREIIFINSWLLWHIEHARMSIKIFPYIYLPLSDK